MTTALNKPAVVENDFDDRMRARLERQARSASELTPTHFWTPPDPDKDVWGRPKRRRRKRQGKA